MLKDDGYIFDLTDAQGAGEQTCAAFFRKDETPVLDQSDFIYLGNAKVSMRDRWNCAH
jgi:hypothetical protein